MIVRGPTRPAYISPIRISLLATPKLEVKSRESPTVANAEDDSNIAERTGMFYIPEIAMALPVVSIT